jgi:hypothetical protein
VSRRVDDAWARRADAPHELQRVLDELTEAGRALVESLEPAGTEVPPSPTNKRGRTTEPGYVNRNGQVVVRPTELAGTDFNQKVYVLRCTRCGNEYGANGSDVHLRLCPNCQDGRPGLAFE